MKTALKGLTLGFIALGLSFSSHITAQSCFDMTKIGVDSLIRCIDYDLRNYPDSAKKYKLDEMFGWDGTLSKASHPRQTLITTNTKDALCPDLNTQPADGVPSILLCSDTYQATDSAKGCAAAFYYRVDPDYPIVHINYAAVLEKGHDMASHPGCEEYAQPHMRFYLVHDGMLECLNMYLNYNDCNGKEGWTSFKDANDKDAIWHDWTTLSIDASQYAGKKIAIVMEAYDCAEESEEGTQITLCTVHEKARLYCNLSCSPLYEMKQTCSPNNTTLIAPKGFTYKWSPVAFPDSVMSTNDTLTFTTPLESTKYKLALGSLGTCDTVSHEINIDATRVIGEVKTTTLCYNDIASFKWDDGKTFVRPGRDTTTIDYEFDTITTTGCDSVARQRIIIQDTTWAVAKLDTMPDTNIYTWRDKEYTQPGTYYDTIRYTSSGCDKTYYKLILINADLQGNITIQPACANDSVATAVFTYTAGIPKKYKISFNEEAKNAGLEDVEIAASGNETGTDVFTFPIPNFQSETNYVKPDTYPVAITVIDTTNHATSFTSSISILYPNWLIEQRWNDMLFIRKAEKNGGYTFTNIRWFKDDENNIIAGRGEHNSYIYSALDVQSYYWAELTRADGKAICTCKMQPKTVGLSDAPQFESEQRVQISPAVITNLDKTIHVTTTLSGNYTMYDLSCTAVQTGVFNTDTDIQISSSTTGAYIIAFISNEGITETKKIFITL